MKIMRMDESEKNPERGSYKYMWLLVKRDAFVSITSVALTIAAIFAG